MQPPSERPSTQEKNDNSKARRTQAGKVEGRASGSGALQAGREGSGPRARLTALGCPCDHAHVQVYIRRFAFLLRPDADAPSFLTGQPALRCRGQLAGCFLLKRLALCRGRGWGK